MEARKIAVAAYLMLLRKFKVSPPAPPPSPNYYRHNHSTGFGHTGCGQSEHRILHEWLTGEVYKYCILVITLPC